MKSRRLLLVLKAFCLLKNRVKFKRSAKSRTYSKIIVSLAAYYQQLKRRQKRYFQKSWLESRSKSSCYKTIQQELKLTDPQCFRSYLRMTPTVFEDLLKTVAPLIQRQNTHLRESISPAERLSLALRYLVTGLSFTQLAFYHRIGRSTISTVIPETLEAIISSLQFEHLRMPSSTSDWIQVSEGFQSMWNFPLCLGALDGKHVLTDAPPNSGSLYHNYKGTFSIILMAMVDSRYRFLFLDIGCNGRVGDARLFDRSTLKKYFESSVNLPKAERIPGSNIDAHYAILGDSAFPLKDYLMKPYPEKNMTKEKRIYNYRLSRARRCVENAFGILVKRWEVFRSPIRTSVSTTIKTVKAACVLHNYLLMKCSSNYGFQVNAENEVEDPLFKVSSNLAPLPTMSGMNTGMSPKQVRNNFCEYFNTEGRVPWQDSAILC